MDLFDELADVAGHEPHQASDEELPSEDDDD